MILFGLVIVRKKEWERLNREVSEQYQQQSSNEDETWQDEHRTENNDMF